MVREVETVEIEALKSKFKEARTDHQTHIYSGMTLPILLYHPQHIDGLEDKSIPSLATGRPWNWDLQSTYH